MADISGFSAAMKTQFLGPIRDMLTTNKVLLFGLRTRNETGATGAKETPDPQGSRPFNGIIADATGIDYIGNTFEMPLRTSRNQGVGSRIEGATLPAPGRQGYKKLTDGLNYNYATFSITGPLLKASASKKGAYEKALTQEMEGVTNDLKRKMNIDAHLNGNGVVVTITDTATSATHTVDTTVHMEIGDVYDVYQSNLSTYIGTVPRVVLSIDRPNRTVVFDSSWVATASCVLVRASSDSTSTVPNNDLASGTINGLEKMIKATGVLHGLNPATAGEGFWASQVIAAASAIVGESLLRQITDAIGFESGSDEDFVYLTTRGIRNRYAQTLISQKRFNDAQSVRLHGGFKAILFDEQPMVVDDHVKPGNVWALNLKEFFWSQMSEWEWIEEDGNTLKWESRKDSYIGILFKYCNLGTYRRQAHGRISGADDDVK
jgi:hypothetical protein